MINKLWYAAVRLLASCSCSLQYLADKADTALCNQ